MLSTRSMLLVVTLLGICAAMAPAGAQPNAGAVGVEDVDRESRLSDIERRISRLLIIGFNGARVTDGEIDRLAAFAERYPLGGYLLLDRNIRDFDQLSALTARLDDVSPETQIIAVDEEGGRIRRLRRLPEIPATPSARAMGQKNLETSFRLYSDLAAGLHSVGVNLNLGPVVDLDINMSSRVIGRLDRSYGSDPYRVAAYAGAFIRAHRDFGVETALKHFPGHGSASGDPHHAPVNAVESWTPGELEPFRLAIADNQPGFVLTSHIEIASKVLGQTVPARMTFSKPAIDYLRDKLGFHGLVITDDLTMGAITFDHSLEDAVAESVLAGHDLVIMANPGRDPATRISRLLRTLAERALKDPALDAAIAISSERVRLFKSLHMSANIARSALTDFSIHTQFAALGAIDDVRIVGSITAAE